MDEPLILCAKDGSIELRSPAAGLFTCAFERGAALTPGQTAGVLVRLGRATRLVVPAGAAGVVVSARPERVRAPVGFGELLYELAPLGAAGLDLAAAAPGSTGAGAAGGVLALRAPQSGRFYQRPAPGAAPFVAPGAALEPGTTVGLVEVMKTFAHVTYRPTGALPERARMVRYLTDDGAAVREGDPLLEVE